MKRAIRKILPKGISKKITELRRKKRAVKIKSSKTQEEVLDCMIAYNEYGGYCIPLSGMQRPAAQKTLKGKIYEPKTLEFINENYETGDIIHAGTYYGDFLPRLSQILSKTRGGKLWGFEPNEESYRCAKITMSINNIKNVELKNIGLGEKLSKEELTVKSQKGENLGGASRIEKREKKLGKTQEIQIKQLDKIIPIERKIAIIQLDVEGYELEALKGGIEMIRRCKPILILEDNEKAIESKWFKENILTLDYEIIGKVHLNTILKIKN